MAGGSPRLFQATALEFSSGAQGSPSRSHDCPHRPYSAFDGHQTTPKSSLSERTGGSCFGSSLPCSTGEWNRKPVVDSRVDSGHIAAMSTHLLFVCSGNVCRSPMAEAMAMEWAPVHGADVEVRSAGTLKLVDRAAAPKAVAVCREIGVDCSRHRSQPLTAELIHWADVVAVMELQHAIEVRTLVPSLPEDTIVNMAAFVGMSEIADPIGAWTKRPFRKVRDQLRTGVQALLEANR